MRRAPLAQLVIASAGIGRWVKAANKRRNASDSVESGGPQPPPAEGRTASLVGSLYPKQATVHEKTPATGGRSGQPVPLGTPTD